MVIYYKLLLLRNSSWLLPVHLYMYKRLWNCSNIWMFFIWSSSNFAFLCQMENLTWPLISRIKLDLSFCLKCEKINVFDNRKMFWCQISHVPLSLYYFCVYRLCTIMKISDFKHLSTLSCKWTMCTHHTWSTFQIFKWNLITIFLIKMKTYLLISLFFYEILWFWESIKTWHIKPVIKKKGLEMF